MEQYFERIATYFIIGVGYLSISVIAIIIVIGPLLMMSTCSPNNETKAAIIAMSVYFIEFVVIILILAAFPSLLPSLSTLLHFN